MNPTEQQIQERAKQIGDRPYFPIPLDRDPLYSASATNGITIRFELMRTFTAENSRLFVSETFMSKIRGFWGGQRNLIFAPQNNCQFASRQVDALLLEMARQELGVTE
jgi:hypothetical protein